ncbi:BRCA1-A complex subunit RAP80 isoform X3 [Syngnathus typhle]|uniref:BRCA1-A complex subunit RAP80 isoform X3 n=1 Tax=Syngnathus typhle TaxID=161592 RepID=UPI002A69A45E|nr:BRCA1-A complex subunit RAP80 isoform X3 [Syngnathus typhle]
MPQRKQRNRDGHPESQLLQQDTQKDVAVNDEEQQSAMSRLPPSLSDRERRWRGRKCKAKPREMTEDEMMALALHLSTQETSAHHEDAAVTKAIKESMLSQEPSRRRSLLTQSDTPCSGPGGWYVSSWPESTIDLTASGDGFTNPSQEAEGKGETKQDQKWKRAETPLSDLPSSPDISTQAWLGNSESELLDSPQSSDSTQIDDSLLRKSPVFSKSGRKGRVAVFPLSQDTPESRKTASLVLNSQHSNDGGLPSARRKSPVFSESDTGDEFVQYLKSPVFGDEARRDPSAQVEASTEFISSPQERSLSSSQPVSPVFPRSPARSKKLADSKNSTLSKSRPVADDSSETELTSYTTLCWSDENADEMSVNSPSPVYPDKKRFQQAHAPQNLETEAGPKASSSGCSLRVSSLNTGQPVPNQSTVHYYWGVPFCPRGLDADAYTQVIVAQMEVYEKSLKEAQRGLLRKAQWGAPILPQSEKSSLSDSSHTKVPRRRGLRRKDCKLSNQDADSLLLEAEEEEEEEEDDEEEEENEELEIETGREEGDPTDIGDCVVCPETQMSEEDCVDPLKLDNSECPKTVTSYDGQSDDGQVVDEEKMMDVSADGKTLATYFVGGDTGRNPTLTNDEEEERGPERSPSPEFETLGFQAAVECPLCQETFPACKIERHAAYCNGDVETETVVVADEHSEELFKPRRKRKRWTAEEEGDATSTDKIQEKCYICQKAVALRDFSKHTDLCIQQRATKIPEQGNLLAALEHSESRYAGAGPSSCRLQRGDVSNLRDNDKEEEAGISMLALSDSPIKSFTPISEATDCLVDFRRQQRLKKPSHKRR